MKKFYAIGEVAKIMGVSVQTLRYYANIKLLEPAYISPSTGYRYYKYEQFHFIDRIKYLQKFGFSLEEIRAILLRNDIPALVNMLDEKKQDVQKAMDDLVATMDMLTWYRNYFVYGQEKVKSHISHFETRYVVLTKVRPDESKADYHIRLHKIKNSGLLKDESYHRQFSLVLDYNHFTKGGSSPSYIGMFFSQKPLCDSRYIVEIPEGDYFCMSAKLLSEEFKPYAASAYFESIDKKPVWVLANEYEDNLCEYTQCPYEIQIPIAWNLNIPNNI